MFVANLQADVGFAVEAHRAIGAVVWFCYFVAVLMSGVVEQDLLHCRKLGVHQIFDSAANLVQPLLTATHNNLCFTKFVSPQQSCSTTPDINFLLSPTLTLDLNIHCRPSLCSGALQVAAWCGGRCPERSRPRVQVSGLQGTRHPAQGWC